MNRPFILVLLAVTLAFSQARPEFEVASIRPSPEQMPNQASVGLHIDGAQVRISYFSLKDYIALAYEFRINQILGPDWIGSERFEVAAKLPEGAKQDDVPKMLQTLLADRFQMKAHRDSKEFPVYALEVAKTGLNLTESAPRAIPETPDRGAVSIKAGGSADGVMIDLGNGAYFSLSLTTLEAKRVTMTTFADVLTRFLDRPVLDRTGLKESYDVALDLSPEDRMAMLIRSAVSSGVILPPQALALLDSASNASLSDALKKKGLTLESRRAPLEVLVVDEIRKTPTEN